MIGDRIKETTTTTGTGTLNLLGASTGYVTFADTIGSGNPCFYVISDGANWEVGYGTVTAGSPDTLSRTAVLASSNADALVNFPAGTKTVWCTAPAERMVYLNGSGAQMRGIPDGTAAAPSIAFESELDTGLYLPAANSIGFSTAGTLRQIITSAGQVVVGHSAAVTTIVSAGLEVIGTGSDAYASVQRYSADAAGSGIILAKSRHATKGSNTIVQSGDVLGDIIWCGANGSGYDYAASISCAVDTTPGASSDMPGRLSFYTTPNASASLVERMRITNAGFIRMCAGAISGGVSTGSGNGVEFDYTSNLFRAWNDGNIVAAFGRRSSDGQMIQFYRDGTQVGNISVTTTATAFNTSSDYRLKEDWQPLNKPALATLLKIPVYSLKFKNDAQDGRYIGWLAHEVQAHMPECVTGNKDDVDDDDNIIAQSVDYSKLVPALLSSVQELARHIGYQPV